MPLYVTGLMGMTRRLQHYDVLAWQPWLLIAEAGRRHRDGLESSAKSCSSWCRFVTVKQLATPRAIRGTAAPWNGPPHRHRRPGILRCLPRVDELDAFWAKKQRVLAKQDLPGGRTGTSQSRCRRTVRPVS
jgi:cytochrome o ubiquinol oxidase subunit 1